MSSNDLFMASSSKYTVKNKPKLLTVRTFCILCTFFTDTRNFYNMYCTIDNLMHFGSAKRTPNPLKTILREENFFIIFLGQLVWFGKPDDDGDIKVERPHSRPPHVAQALPEIKCVLNIRPSNDSFFTPPAGLVNEADLVERPRESQRDVVHLG
jgi:hypothetical protein